MVPAPTSLERLRIFLAVSTLGTVAGTPLTRDEKVPVSRAFTAATDTRYVVPFARPVITNGPVAVANEVNVTPLSRE